MMNNNKEIIGLFPAGGNATRIAPLPCSKEIYPVGIHHPDKEKAIRPKVVGHYLLEKMRMAGSKKAYILLRHGKWDIPAYFSKENNLDMHLAYIMVENTLGVPYTLDPAYPFIHNSLICFGFPDILFHPDNAFIQLLEKQAETDADLILGLFTADCPHKVDMVKLDKHDKVIEILIKPLKTELIYTWLIAVWSPKFSLFLHDFLHETKLSAGKFHPELFMGDVINAALNREIIVEKVIFKNAGYLDIGTPEDLLKSYSWKILNN